MTITALQPPALIVTQQFARRPAISERPLSAFIFGPLAHTVRYTEASEKASGLLGAYFDTADIVDGIAQTLYPWPNRPLGVSIDEEFTRLFVERGLFRYWQSQTDSIEWTSRNRLYSPADVFRTNASATSNVLDAGVAIGDRVFVQGIDDEAAPFTLATYVAGLEGDQLPAIVLPAVAASTNRQPQAGSASITPQLGNTDNLSVVLSAGAYNGFEYGLASETYLVTVAVAGPAGTARLNIVSGSGQDNQSLVLTENLDVVQPIGTRGVTLTFSEDEATNFALGDSWLISINTEVVAPGLTVAGTYTGTINRSYIVEVVTAGELGEAQLFITSQDGTDTSPSIVIDTDPVTLGSYGLTLEVAAATGLWKGDKWIIQAIASTEGPVRTIVLAHDLPANLDAGDAPEFVISLFKMRSVEISRQSLVPGIFNFISEDIQVGVKAGIETTFDDVKLADALVVTPLVSVSEFGNVNQLFIHYRGWYPASSDIFAVESDTELDAILPGPTDPDNPLKFAMDVARLGGTGETIYGFAVGRPESQVGWAAATDAASRSDATYGYVPLTHDPAILTSSFSSVVSANSNIANAYRVLWTSSAFRDRGPVLWSETSEDNAIVLAVAEDDPLSSGTQITQVRITSGNADLVELGVRPGDEVRYIYNIDAWGNTQYVSRKVDAVRSATTLVVDRAYADFEAIPRRVEIHRVYQPGELRDQYITEASQWGSDLVRHVVAPVVHIGGRQLPAYYLAGLLASMRSYYVPQQPLSTLQIPGVLQIGGLESFSYDDLNRIAAAGGFICYYDYRSKAVRIRHAITTGETEILAIREESMVSARHAALFAINARLAVYAGQINLGDDEQFETLAEQIYSELRSVAKDLQVRGYSPELGGLIRDLIINEIVPSQVIQDELIIRGELVLGRPGNRISFFVLVR